MKVCYTAGQVKKLENCFSVSTNAVEIRIWFLTDDILRIRAGFDGDWDEASYSLTMTAWDSRTDELMVTVAFFAVGVFVFWPVLLVAPGLASYCNAFLFNRIFDKYGMTLE